MKKHQKVAELVQKVYTNSDQEFAQWMWTHHVPVVAKEAEALALRFGADPDIAVAGAWLHDFGDAFVDRHDNEHEHITLQKTVEILTTADYTESEIQRVLNEVIAPHSCKNGVFPTTIEGKVMASGDALAHLTTDFYVQFCWMHLPEGKTYDQYLSWVAEKLERDFHSKIFFEEVKSEVRQKYVALKLVFLNQER